MRATNQDDGRPVLLRLASEGAPEETLIGVPAPPPLAPRRPSPAVALLGRNTERTNLAARLRSHAQRLVTLVGTGGVGKTSLALQVAADLAADPAYPDGVAVAQLAAVTASAELPLALAEALGLQLEGARPADEQLLTALGERGLLLVLDNLEQLLTPTQAPGLIELLGRLLAAAPHLCLLATSRERLGLRDEQVFPVEGLALPHAEGGPRVEQADAMQLFVERAQRVNPAFALTAANRPVVARLCRQLGGIPLAIELAAASMRALTPQELAAALEHSLDVLAGAARDLPARHQSIGAALDHSWQLLAPDEQAVLARLAVFRGGCDLTAATTVAGATLPVLTALIDKSLLRRQTLDTGSWYTLHELVRQDVARRLAEDPAALEAAERRHIAYYAGLLKRLVTLEAGSSPEDWALLARNTDNLRAAWARAAAMGDTANILAMARGLLLLFDLHSWLQDAVALFGQAAEALRPFGAAAAEARGRVLSYSAGMLMRMGRPTASRAKVEEGIALLEAAGARVSNEEIFLLGATAMQAGHFAEARAQFERSINLGVAAGDTFMVLWAKAYLATVAMHTGDLAAAATGFQHCITLWREQKYQRGLAYALAHMAAATRCAGRPEAGEGYLYETLQLASALRDRLSLGLCLQELGALALGRADEEEARYLLIESCANLQALGEHWIYGRSRSILLRLEVQRGDYLAAREGCRELLRIAREGVLILVAEAAYGLALLFAAEGDDGEAAGILAALEAIPAEFTTLQQAAALRSAVKARVDPLPPPAEPRGPEELIPWLEALAGRPAAPKAKPALPPPAAPAGSPGELFIATTGEPLSPREVEVLRMLVAGASNQAIADTLVISRFTVKHHVASILAKLGVTSRTEAALRGRDLGLTPLHFRPPV